MQIIKISILASLLTYGAAALTDLPKREVFTGVRNFTLYVAIIYASRLLTFELVTRPALSMPLVVQGFVDMTLMRGSHSKRPAASFLP